jgi:hypothetical protein
MTTNGCFSNNAWFKDVDKDAVVGNAAGLAKTTCEETLQTDAVKPVKKRRRDVITWLLAP